MSIINHKNIIKLIDTFENEEYIFIVMEYMKGGNLTSYLKKKHFCISERKTKEIIKQIAEGISYLHNYGIIHRDIKSDNILLSDNSDNFNIKLLTLA